jgi:subtilisin family serine protease
LARSRISTGPDSSTEATSSSRWPLAAGGWADGIDNGLNGFEDDLIGWDFFGDDNDPIDEAGHGTEVAGVIGAVGNNGLGVAGLNWQCRLMTVRLGVRGGGVANHTPEELERVARATAPAIRYATANGAHVSNNSFGAPAALIPQDILDDAYLAIEEAAAAGHLMVFAALNDGQDNDAVLNAPVYFGLPNMIAVANTIKNDKLNSKSGFGAATVDLGAPGTKIPSTGLGGGYETVYGTSFATPHVAGAAALILAANPDLDIFELRSLLLDHVDPVKVLESLTVTGGRLNVARAVAAAVAP